MTIVAEMSWDEVSHPAFGTTPVPHVSREAVTLVADRARAALPASHSRIDEAAQLVLAGAVTALPDGTARVASECNGETVYHVVNGHCDCGDYAQAPGHWCTHRLAHALSKRARQPVPPVKAPTIPTEFVTTIHGKEFVMFSGLLALAHAQGLISLSAELASVTADLALAKATAVFADGRTFSEAADATPDNVNAGVKKHYVRCALTRAKSRALRDGLNIAMVALEELD